ncbi:MAG: hypothetical protein ABSD81_05025 [Methanomicrobiales archaeon]|jgi:hypothetical protein
MNARFQKILILTLCGALLFIAGCATTAPSGGAVPTPAGGTTNQVSTTNPDMGTIVSLLRTINDQVTLVAENTHPQATGKITGNIVLFDTMGNTANAIKSGTSIVALPQGSCDIAIFAQSVPLYVTVEEEKDLSAQISGRYYRNRQNCFDDPMCRETVSLDDDFSYLYIEYKPYNPGDSLNQVTLSYRC